MNKKMILLALVCTVPTFMFGQITKYEKGLEAAEKAATKTGAVITEGITAGTTKALQEAAINTTPIEAATANGPIYTGMNVGTNAYMQSSAIPSTPMDWSKIRENITRAARVATTFVRNNTIDLAERLEGNSTVRNNRPGINLYTNLIPCRYYRGVLKLSPRQQKVANKFYMDFLKRENAFSDNDFDGFSSTLGAITGLAYTGNEITDRALVDFAKKSPQEYTFAVDFVAIPVLRLHGQTSMIKELANYRSTQENWLEGNRGETFILYLNLYKNASLNILPEDVKILFDNLSEEGLNRVNLEQKGPQNFLRTRSSGYVLGSMQLYLRGYEGYLHGWNDLYKELFFTETSQITVLPR